MPLVLARENLWTHYFLIVEIIGGLRSRGFYSSHRGGFPRKNWLVLFVFVMCWYTVQIILECSICLISASSHKIMINWFFRHMHIFTEILLWIVFILSISWVGPQTSIKIRSNGAWLVKLETENGSLWLLLQQHELHKPLEIEIEVEQGSEHCLIKDFKVWLEGCCHNGFPLRFGRPQK